MDVAETIEQVRELLGPVRRSGNTIGLVPTMGALHAGHLSLIDAAEKTCDFVVVSIFINPAQFAPNEDLASYPRTGRADLAACRARGVDLVFAPTAQEMHRPTAVTEVTVNRLSAVLCGQSRPTHFAGVCTVVAKLFNIVAPDKAFFGAKDFQQVVILRRMAEDLNFPVQIVLCPIVREADGLAMSSRNAHLSAAERAQAAAIWQSLQMADETIRHSRPPAASVIQAVRSHLATHAPAGGVDYVEIVDPRELTNVENTDRQVLIALAVGFGRARLIDNILVDGPKQRP